MLLRIRGTDIASAILLRARYAMSGTAIGVWCYAMSITDIAYGPPVGGQMPHVIRSLYYPARSNAIASRIKYKNNAKSNAIATLLHRETPMLLGVSLYA
eukprot:3732073-Rhodomonas_salina.3